MPFFFLGQWKNLLLAQDTPLIWRTNFLPSFVGDGDRPCSTPDLSIFKSLPGTFELGSPESCVVLDELPIGLRTPACLLFRPTNTRAGTFFNQHTLSYAPVTFDGCPNQKARGLPRVWVFRISDCLTLSPVVYLPWLSL